jgi:hypothetical protein
MELDKVKKFLSEENVKSELKMNRTIDIIRDSGIPVKPEENATAPAGGESKPAAKKSAAGKKPASAKKTTKKETDRE